MWPQGPCKLIHRSSSYHTRERPWLSILAPRRSCAQHLHDKVWQRPSRMAQQHQLWYNYDFRSCGRRAFSWIGKPVSVLLSSSSSCPVLQLRPPFPCLHAMLGQRSQCTDTLSRWAHSLHTAAISPSQLEVLNSLAPSFPLTNVRDVAACNPSPTAVPDTPSCSSRLFQGFAEFLTGFSCSFSEQWKDLNSKDRPALPPGFSCNFCTLI